MNGSDTRRRAIRVLLAAAGLMLAGDIRSQVGDGQPEDAGFFGLLRTVRPTLGPLLLRGRLTSEYRVESAPGGSSQRDFVETGNLAASSYVFQPWFAQLNGNLGFVRGRSSGLAGSRSTSLTGGAGLALFPASRFPFTASYNVSDSRSSGEVIGSEYRSTLLNLRQSLRTRDDLRFSASLDRSVLESPAIGRDVLNAAGGSFSSRFGEHDVSLDGRWSANTGGRDGAHSRVALLTGRHGYSPSGNLNVETITTYNQLDQDGGGIASSALSNRFVQVASFATWRPEEDEPLFDENHPMLLTGALRLTAIASELTGSSAENVSLSGSAGINYTLSPQTRFAASGSLTQSRNPAAGSLTLASLNGILSHAPPPVAFGLYTHSWNASGGASAIVGGTQSRQSLFGQASHQATRNFRIGTSAELAFSAGQGASLGLATTGGNSLAINHNALATLTLDGDATTRTYLSLSASDARSFGNASGEFQLVNLQATRQTPVSALSFWSANLTVQGFRQRTGTVPGGGTAGSQGTGFSVSTFGSLAYQHRRAFGVPRLNLQASYTVNQDQLRSRALGDLTAPRENVRDALDARLEYRIGKLDARLTFRSATVNSRRNTGLYLRVTRHF